MASLFFEAAARHPDVDAFRSVEGPPTSFAALRARVERFAGGLTRHGFSTGDKALFMLPMSADLYVAVLGALAVGGVAVFVDPWVSLRRIATLAAAAGARAFVGSPRSHLLRLLAPGLRRIPLTINAARFARPFARSRLATMTGDADAALATVAPDASALITYTTGSSGAAKGVNRTHAILAAQHDVIRQEFPTMPGDVDLTTFPVFALSNLAAGISTVIPPINLRRVAAANGARVLQAMRTCGVTTMAASPPLFDVLANHLGARGGGMAAPTLRRIVTGGAPVRDDQLHRWRNVWPGAEIVVAYGSSEAEPVASINAEERLALGGGERGYCVGRPVRAVRTRLIAISKGPVDELRDLPTGRDTVGELVVAGPHVCRDYVNDPRAFAENKIRDGDVVWHRMGDTGYFDAEHRFWLVGRVHSTIDRRGEPVHPQIIEQAARGDDDRIRRVAAVGVPDAALGERVVVVVESDSVDVVAGVRARLGHMAQAPVDALVVTRTPLPVDPRHNSKIDYQRLRELLESGALK